MARAGNDLVGRPFSAVDARWMRVSDIIFAAAGLLFLSPLLIVVASVILLTSRGPVFFKHKRIGFQGRSFDCLKFRTMQVDAEQRLEALLASDPKARAEWARDHKLRRDPRITMIGSFLRKTSIDELPQLINVLRGEMSLVGPRPITASEVSRYGARYWSYCKVRPGITGLWQVSGRNDVSYRRRVAMDAVFARRSSVGLYWRILANTPQALLLSRGAY